MRKVVLALVLLAVPALVLPGSAAAQARKATPVKKKAVAAPKPTVHLAGVRIVGPGFGTEDDNVRPFNWTSGVTVAVAVRVAAPYALVGVDREKSTLEIVDSQGNVLDQPEVDWNPDFTKDGTTALLELEAKGLPADGSTHVGLKGNVVFTAASGTKVIKANSVKLEKGVAVKLGTASITVDEATQDEANSQWQVSFTGATPVIKGIKKLTARDGKGAAIETRWYGGGGWTEQYSAAYMLNTAAKGPLNFEFEMFDGLRELPVAIDLKAGVGIPPQQ
jgi:hypothetical protein